MEIEISKIGRQTLTLRTETERRVERRAELQAPRAGRGHSPFSLALSLSIRFIDPIAISNFQFWQDQAAPFPIPIL